MFKEIENKDEIQQGKVIVDFYSKTCAPCKRMLRELEKLTKADNTINIIKIETSSEIGVELASKMDVSRLPNIKVLENGEEKANFLGIVNVDNILEAYKA